MAVGGSDGRRSIRRATRWSTSTRSAIPCRRPASWAAASSTLLTRRPVGRLDRRRYRNRARAEDVLLLPSVQQGSGPFPRHGAALDRRGRAINGGAAPSPRLFLPGDDDGDLPRPDRRRRPDDRRGSVRRATGFSRACSRRHRAAGHCVGGSATGTSIGAALLASDHGTVQGKGEKIEPPADPAWADYARSWRAAVDAQG